MICFSINFFTISVVEYYYNTICAMILNVKFNVVVRGITVVEVLIPFQD